MSEAWPVVPLGEVLVKSESWVELVSDAEYQEVTVRLWGRGVTQRRQVTGAEIGSERRLQVRPRQFILSRIDARNGAFGLIPQELDGAVVSNDFPVFDVDENRMLPEYLGWMSRTMTFVEACKTASEGTTNRVRLKKETFLRIPLPLPPIAEQQRIVAKIEHLAGLLEEALRLNSQTTEEADALLSATASTRLADIPNPATPLREWIDPSRDGIQTGPFGAQLSSSEFTDSGCPILTIGNIQYDGLSLSKLKFVSKIKAKALSRYRLAEGDILFARMGTVGRCCVVPSEAIGWLINYHIIRVALNRSRVEPRFIHWTIRASLEIENYLGDKIRGATREGVNSKIVSELPVRVPPLPDQRSIVTELDKLQAKVNTFKRTHAESAVALDSMVPSILNRAFKGEL